MQFTFITSFQLLDRAQSCHFHQGSRGGRYYGGERWGSLMPNLTVCRLDLLYSAGLKNAPDSGKRLEVRNREKFCVWVSVCAITHIRCDLTQGPNGVYSLHCVIGDDYRGLTAAEHNLHVDVRCILHFKQTWENTQVKIRQLLILTATKKEEQCVICVCVI